MPKGEPRTTETLAQAAARYGVHPKTIRRRVADGTITAYRIGPRLVRVDPDEVDAAFAPIPAIGRIA